MSSQNHENHVKLFHSFVPHKYRLLTLVGFIRSHLKDSIVVICCSTGVAEHHSLLFNFLELRAGFLHGKQDQAHREDAVRRFNSGEVPLLFATALLMESTKINRPTWVIHYDIPKEVNTEIKIINNIRPEKFLIFLDESHKQYLELLKTVKLDAKDATTDNISFDVKKIPPVQDQVFKLLDKNHRLYLCSQDGYRELIQTYVNHDNSDIFNAQKLNILDVAINFGLKAPPKLPLSK
ncbi:hypothetical protein TRFO_25693 [Tritrichomonas foetus]|uniref:ATP-dependent RNA helicase n=1 Tax=Tritrichomonas foetus TaxID=1144522 RepID=A0A1J4K508_9EUKA|nr:hypothetical protein TRFO_25693 [Tritrichomonas foetus]|eukprot:OHT06283.1 hypothetical protein TRFO_25693 [Tritrichomonas foetus]